MMTMNKLIAIATLCLVLASSAVADDWPQFLGPNRNGISKETGFNTDVSKAKTLWTANVGLGFSSFSVAGGRVYTLGHDNGMESVFCLDAATGEQKWKHSYPCEKIARFYEGGSSSTPTIDGNRAYVLGKEGQFFCFDAATGKPQWLKDLKKELGANVPEWGFASSPLIHGDLVIIQANCTAAFAKDTGKLVWKTTPFQQAYGSPLLFEKDGKSYIADLNTAGLIIVDAAKGQVLAETRWKTSFSTNSTTPIVHGDHLFISTGYGKGCGLFKFTGSDLEEIYTSKEMANHMNNCVLHEGHLYGFHGNAHGGGKAVLRCIDFKTGATKWTRDDLGCGALTMADGKLIIMSERCDLVIAEATPAAYKEISRKTGVLKGRSWTQPVLANGRIYVRNVPGDVACVAVGR
ncbi:MAG: PQQ-binding-like beta-propeller repeat protein [Phycisphaeraceae bacterium]